MVRAGAAGGNNLPREGVVLLGPATGARGAAALPTPGEEEAGGQRPPPISSPRGRGSACQQQAPRGCRADAAARGGAKEETAPQDGGDRAMPGEPHFAPRGVVLADLPAGSSPRPPRPVFILPSPNASFHSSRIFLSSGFSFFYRGLRAPFLYRLT